MAPIRAQPQKAVCVTKAGVHVYIMMTVLLLMLRGFACRYTGQSTCLKYTLPYVLETSQTPEQHNF